MSGPHGHSHDHSHGHLARAGARYAGRLRVSLILIVTFLVVQVVAGIVSGSLALLSDAGHMATDALGMGMALAAITAANHAARDRGRNSHRTFGLYRLEILAALMNAVLLFGVAGYVLVEAALRLGEPPHIATAPVLIVGVIGLTVNIICFLLLRGGAQDSMNMRGAYLEVLSDLVGSVGVIIGAIVMATTGWAGVDAVVGAAIGLFILPRAYRLGRDAIRVLVQAAPAGLSTDEVQAALASLDGVADVHDLHIWTLTSEMDVLTAHLAVTEGTSPQQVLIAAQQMLVERFDLQHATLQVEADGDERCNDMHW